MSLGGGIGRSKLELELATMVSSNFGRAACPEEGGGQEYGIIDKVLEKNQVGE